MFKLTLNDKHQYKHQVNKPGQYYLAHSVQDTKVQYTELKVILYSYLILKKMNERITDS